MKLKLPKSVKVLGKRYKVVTEEVLVKNNGADVLVNKHHIHMGQQDSRACTIVINGDQSKEQAKDTLVHEMLHACDYTLQLDLTELQVHRLAACVVAMISDNPEVGKLLISK